MSPVPVEAAQWVAQRCVEVAGGQAVVRAKVWPRGDAEPAAWSIEFTDPFPNEEGSLLLLAIRRAPR